MLTLDRPPGEYVGVMLTDWRERERERERDRCCVVFTCRKVLALSGTDINLISL